MTDPYIPPPLQILAENPVMTTDPSPLGPVIPSKLLSLLPLGAAVVAIALAWGELRTQMRLEQKFREEAISQVSQELNRIGASYDKLETRARELEEQGARIDERFSMILSLMTELKTQVTALTQKDSGN
jgi:hypothetical protein